MKASEIGTREGYLDRVATLIVGTASGDRKFTELAAESVYWSMQDKSHFEANALIHKWADIRPRDIPRLRAWLVEFGPFTLAEDRKITVGDKEIVVKKAVKYSEKAHQSNLGGLSPDEAFGRLSSMITIAQWSKKREEPKPVTQDEITKSFERLEKKARDNGLKLPVQSVQMPEPASLVDAVKALVASAQGKDGLDKLQKDLLAKLIVALAEVETEQAA